MGIQEEIFEEFFRKLSEDEAIPNSIIEELKKLLESGEVSQEEIFEAIERVYRDVGND